MAVSAIGVNSTSNWHKLAYNFGPVTSAINATVAQAGVLLLVNHMLNCLSSRQCFSAAWTLCRSLLNVAACVCFKLLNCRCGLFVAKILRCC